jgi:hypothetical protein
MERHHAPFEKHVARTAAQIQIPNHHNLQPPAPQPLSYTSRHTSHVTRHTSHLRHTSCSLKEPNLRRAVPTWHIHIHNGHSSVNSHNRSPLNIQLRVTERPRMRLLDRPLPGVCAHAVEAAAWRVVAGPIRVPSLNVRCCSVRLLLLKRHTTQSTRAMQPLTCSSVRDAFVSCRHSTSQPRRRRKQSTLPYAPAVTQREIAGARARDAAGTLNAAHCRRPRRDVPAHNQHMSNGCAAACSTALAPTGPLRPIAAAAGGRACLAAAFQTTGRCGCSAGGCWWM